MLCSRNPRAIGIIVIICLCYCTGYCRERCCPNKTGKGAQVKLVQCHHATHPPPASAWPHVHIMPHVWSTVHDCMMSAYGRRSHGDLKAFLCCVLRNSIIPRTMTHAKPASLYVTNKPTSSPPLPRCPPPAPGCTRPLQHRAFLLHANVPGRCMTRPTSRRHTPNSTVNRVCLSAV